MISNWRSAGSALRSVGDSDDEKADAAALARSSELPDNHHLARHIGLGRTPV
jgi:hypothetical protein